MSNVTVKPLEWWEPDHTNNYTHGAKTIIGTYYVHIDGGRHVGCMETFVNDKIEQWEGPERGHLYEAQSDCFSDFEARILSALSVPCLQEPDGWQWRFKRTDGAWSDWNDGKARYWAKEGKREIEERPLYSHPNPDNLEAIRRAAGAVIDEADAMAMTMRRRSIFNHLKASLLNTGGA